MAIDGIGLAECRARYVDVGTVPSFDVQGSRGFVQLLQALEGETPAMTARKRSCLLYTSPSPRDS